MAKNIVEHEEEIPTWFNLSKFRFVIPSYESWAYKEEDVKEFIRRLKEEMSKRVTNFNFNEFIDKLAGEKLI